MTSSHNDAHLITTQNHSFTDYTDPCYTVYDHSERQQARQENDHTYRHWPTRYLLYPHLYINLPFPKKLILIPKTNQQTQSIGLLNHTSSPLVHLSVYGFLPPPPPLNWF